MDDKKSSVEKLETHIPGLDLICEGGIPKGRTTLVSGTAGSGKTIFAAQFLAEGITKCGQHGVFVTFEESPADIRRNLMGFGWDVSKWEADGQWAFVDASPQADEEKVLAGDYNFGALLARLEHAIAKVSAQRVSMDSVAAIFTQFPDRTVVRKELFKITMGLKAIDVTSLLTFERVEEYGHIAQFGVEEFVTDNVIIMRNHLEDEKRRRTIEILKFRGTTHQKGEYPFAIMPNEGIIAIPISAMELKQSSSEIRISSGIKELDQMCGGGFFRDSIILVSGATGTGKTLTSTHFIAGNKTKKERCLLFAFEESREQLFRNASGWGIDFRSMEASGQLKVLCTYPETMGMEDHLIKMKGAINEFNPTRVAVDSLSALERISTVKSFRQFVIGLTSFIKHKETAGLFTSTTPTLLGGDSVTEAHISTITDSIILLRYVEMFGEMRRGLTVLKMRGSLHEKQIREYVIDQEGMHIGKAFTNVSGIISGNPHHVTRNELSRMEDLFTE
jgi:circadian clock protein KaiC